MNESLIYSLGLTLFASGLSYGLLQAKISANNKSIADMKAEQQKINKKVNGISIDLTRTQTNLERTHEDVKTLESKIDKVLDTLNDLNINVGVLIDKAKPKK